VRTVLVAVGILSVVLLGACSASHRASARRPAQNLNAGTSTASAPTAYGTITGRYYSDGGPPPLSGPPPVTPIAGDITVSNAESHTTYHPRQDSRGYFKVVVPVGTYGVMAESSGVAEAMTTTVTVTPGKTVDADLGIHTP
jgi:hypothetical protein